MTIGLDRGQSSGLDGGQSLGRMVRLWFGRVRAVVSRAYGEGCSGLELAGGI